MPSPQSEVNQITEAKPINRNDSAGNGALGEMMKELHSYQGSRIMNNAHGGVHALTGNDALNKIQKMLDGKEQGQLDFPSVFPNNSNVDSCGKSLQKQEMLKQFEDKKDDDIGGVLKKSH